MHITKRGGREGRMTGRRRESNPQPERSMRDLGPLGHLVLAAALRKLDILLIIQAKNRQNDAL